MITLGEASRLTGLGKTTLARAIKAGRLSATRATTGTYEIDPAELARCYPFQAPTEATGATVAATGPVTVPARPPTRLARRQFWKRRSPGCGEIGDLLRRQLDEIREDRDRWRSQAEATQRLITDRSQAEAPGRDRRPWWHWIAGRENLKLIALLGCILVMLAIYRRQAEIDHSRNLLCLSPVAAYFIGHVA
jgi:hypothetical protein